MSIKCILKFLRNKLFFIFVFMVLLSFILFVKSINIYVTLIIFGFAFYFLILSIIIVKKYADVSNARPFPKKVPTVAVVTIAYNNFQPIMDTIKNIKTLKYPIPFKIYVITDGTCKFLDKVSGVKQIILPKYFFEKSGTNQKSKVLNEGLKQIHEELVLQLDGDTVPSKDALMKLTGTIRDEVVMAIGSVGVTNSNNFLEKVQVLEYNFGFGFPRMVMTAMNSLDIGTGAFCLFKKAAFDEVGGYDVNNITEDKEITYKFIEHGYRTEFVIDAKSKTEVPSTWKKFFIQRIRWSRGGFDVTNKYIHFIFKKGLGYFSFFFVYTTLSLVIGMMFVSKTIYDVISNLVLNLYSAISNIWIYGLSLADLGNLHISLFSIFNSFLILVLISLAISIYFISISFDYNHFKMKNRYIIPLFYLIFVHGFILLFIAIISILYSLFGVKYRW